MFTFTRYWISDEGKLLEEQCRCRVEGATVVLVEGAALPCVTLSETGAGYARTIRGIARSLWNGSISYDQAYSLMMDNIRLGMHEAWAAGAKECGITPVEYTGKEMSELAWMIADQQTHIAPYLFFIEQNSKANKGKWGGQVRARANAWGNRYAEARNKAMTLSCGNKKLMWMLHGLRPTKVSCVDCLKYNGRVYRASTWLRYIQPQDSRLACHGIHCGCLLVPTDEKCTPGRPPSPSGG